MAAILIPCLPRGWKKENLFRRVRETLEQYPSIPEHTELIIQPQLSEMLKAQKKHPISLQSDEHAEFFWRFSEKILDLQGVVCPEMVFLLLGNIFFPEEQMRRFSEMIQPYLKYINHLIILYEPDESDSGFGQERLEDAIQDYTDMFHFEYGLVSQIWRGSEYSVKNVGTKDKKGMTLCLDSGYQGKIPFRALREGDIYLDIYSSERKETLFRRKARGICYLSPLKYLDTMVKSGYDK